MDAFLLNVVVVLAYSVLFIISTIGPFLIVPVAIWIGLWIFEAFLGAIPLLGKPLAWIPRAIRTVYEKAVKWCAGKIVKYGGSFFHAVGRGMKIVGGHFFAAVGRGAKRTAQQVYQRLKKTPSPPS